MTQIKLFNSLSGKKESLKAIDKNHLKIYVCGPTIYDRPHIGNARSVVIYDLWYRLFLKLFPKVTYARNITDVDDKINASALKQKISIQELTSKNLEYFHKDIGALNNLSPTIEPKATQHISDIISMIEKLLISENAYESQGHVLFNVKSYSDYGKLSNRVLDEMISGSRIEIADYKKDPLDFVLWKPASKNDDISSIFDSPWGKGRPGWHIECSAMSCKYLGNNFDIHGGGADLQFPHHENEIAQSKCANSGSSYANYWVHNGFLTVNGEKMSKSLNNFFTIKDLLDQDIPAMAIRYFLLSAHYRKPLDYNQKALLDSQKSIDKFYLLLIENKIDQIDKNLENPYLDKIVSDLSNDLNTLLAFATLHEISKLIKSSQSKEQKSLLSKNLLQCLEFLGLFNKEYLLQLSKLNSTTNIDENFILEKISLRKQAKESKNWALADEIKKELLEQNIVLTDLAGGETSWSLK